MFDDLIQIGNYGAHALSGSGWAGRPEQLQAMSAEQRAKYGRRQGDPTNVPMSMRSLAGIQNAWQPPVRRPTMTLAEYDARRAAFHPS